MGWYDDHPLTSETLEKRERTLKYAVTYLRKATDMLHPRDWWGAPSYTYRKLLKDALDAALDIVEELSDDYFEETEYDARIFGLGYGTYNDSDEANERLQKIVEAMKTRRAKGNVARRIRLLENTEGRTPEEAAAYLAKAQELREGKARDVHLG